MKAATAAVRLNMLLCACVQRLLGTLVFASRVSEHYTPRNACLVFICWLFSSSCPCWFCPASRRRNAALVRRRRRRRQKMSEHSGVNKRADSSLSFLCEVIMHSPRCFCSHANEVDRVGNHFQPLSRGGSGERKTKAGTKEGFAAAAVRAEKWR